MKRDSLKKAIELRHRLHEHPEASMEEIWTKAYLIRFLKEHTDLEIVDHGRWFYAAYRKDNEKKNIAFRADFDAVRMDESIELPYGSKFPGVAHKCGHDGHSATLAALALEVDQEGADRNVFFLFQHGEETAEGAIECVRMIKDENIQEIYTLWNSP